MQRITGPTVRLKIPELQEAAKAAGIETNTELARHMDISRAAVTRLLAETAGPGESVIAAALTAFPHLKFEDLFEITSERAA